eukprot:scaffold11448_cov90-Isochrysis_galbana.AAC.3
MERLAEEEVRQAKEALRLQMFKDRMAQEEKYSRINRLKVLNQWRKLMRLVKARGCAPRPFRAAPPCQSVLGVAIGGRWGGGGRGPLVGGGGDGALSSAPERAEPSAPPSHLYLDSAGGEGAPQPAPPASGPELDQHP